jgi:hypothetical protein
MPVDTFLTPFWIQLVHSKITVTRASFLLAMNLLWVFDLLNSSILIRNEEKERKEKIEVTNLKSNSKRSKSIK